MGIDAKETGAILWKILGFSMNTSFNFMRNHPILSSVFIFLLATYIFLPSLLFFLIYSSPVVACGLVYAREKLGLRFSEGESSGGKCHLRQQRSVRRNARMKVEEWDSQTSEEEKDKVILTSLYNDLLGRTPQFEESPKAIETPVAEEKNNTFGDQDSGTSSFDLVCNCEINEDNYRESDGKEETKEEISDVNEYGMSEIERNKRLESLIARRRARRLFKLALHQRNKLQSEDITTQSNNNLQVTVPRNNNNNIFERRRNYSSDKIPGSAPSVMLQGRNPFDIPYDPQEERPNLTGDSFDEEFSLFNHKDMFFVRHESFCRFASPQCMNSPVSASEISTTRKCLDLDNEYSEQKLLSDGKEDEDDDDDRSVVSRKSREREVDTDSSKEDSDSSSCSEESESELSCSEKAELREAICHSRDNYPNLVVNQTRNNIPSPLPRAAGAPRLDDNSMFYSRSRCGNSHSRSFSVASDMQVEVSEIGSPPTTIDWIDDCSNGGESYIYDTDIDREILRGEETQERLSHQSETGSKEETNKVITIPDQKNSVLAFDGTKQVGEEICEKKPMSCSKVFEHSNSGKFGGLSFHTSMSLSSITEEPETMSDSIENMNYLTEHRSLPCLDSSTKDLIDAEVVDVKENDDKDINGNTKPREYEATQSILDTSLDSPYIKMEEEEPKLENSLEEKTRQPENEALQSDLNSPKSHVVTESLENKVMEESEPELVEHIDEKAKPIEEEKTQIILESSPSHPETELTEDLEGNSSTLDKSTDQEISKENEKSGFIEEDMYAELTQEHNNTTNGEEESQDSQPWTQQSGINSSEWIPPGTLEISQQPEHEDVIVSNTISQEIAKDESVAVANDSVGSENNGGENLKLNDADEKKLELELVSREGGEESKQVVEAMHIAPTETTE